MAERWSRLVAFAAVCVALVPTAVESTPHPRFLSRALTSVDYPVLLTTVNVTRIASLPNFKALSPNDFQSPVPNPLALSSTFGPRWKTSEAREDFHLGLDLYDALGTPIVSMAAGVVTKVTFYQGGGNTVRIQSDVNGNGAAFHGRTISKVYAHYMHLESVSVSEGDPVAKGEQIGTMGESGSTSFVHLHFETRLQGYCSLDYQTSNHGDPYPNPNSNCFTGFDPHVHPFLFVGGERGGPKWLYEIAPLQGFAFAVQYNATRGHLDLDVIETDLGIVGFNWRAGIDATTLETLDNLSHITDYLSLRPRRFASFSTVTIGAAADLMSRYHSRCVLRRCIRVRMGTEAVGDLR